VSWSQPLSRSLSLLLKPCYVLLCPPLDFSSRRALLHHRLKSRSSTLFAPGCHLIDHQRTHSSMLLARAFNRELRRLLGKPDDPIWHSGLFDFPVPGPFCPANGRRVRNGHLLYSSLRGQNPDPYHPGWKCIGGGTHGPYHPTQGGQGGNIIGGGPHGPGIGGLTEK
jgi:hypothetical protein